MRARHQAVAALVAAVGLSALGGTSAPAQSDAREALAGCRAQPTEALRLNCMEGLVLELSSSAPASPVVSAGEPAVSAAVSDGETDASSALEASEADPDSRGDGWRRLLPFGGDRDGATPTPTSSGVESLGAERLQTRDDAESQREVMAARVVSFEEVAVHRLRVELDNGQVWVQRDAVPPWREEQYGAPDEVEIFASRFGGYRMRLVGKNLTLGVERLR